MKRGEALEQWQSTVLRVAREIHQQFPEVTREDIEQEAWAWIFARPKMGPGRWKWLKADMAKRAWEEVQQMEGSIRRLYTDREMAVLVEIVLDEEKMKQAQENWQPWLVEVLGAYGDLEEDDAMVLHLRYRSHWKLREISEFYHCSIAEADRKVWKAIGHLQDILEGEPPDEPEKEYTRKGSVISNAKARHIIERNEYDN